MMMQWKVPSNRFRGWALWTLATGIGWAIIVFPGLKMRNLEYSSWSMILPGTLTILLGCIALGIVVGLMQYFALHFDSQASIWWILVSLVSYAGGMSLGFLISTVFVGITSPQVLANTHASFMIMPLAPTMFVGGIFAGFVQAYVLRKNFGKENRRRKMLLWTFGTALGWIFGFVIASLSWGWNMPFFVQSALAGIIIGAISGALLIACVREQAS
jgi:hypothetical protein